MYCRKTKDNWRDWAYTVLGEGGVEILSVFWLGNLQERGNLRNPVVGGNVILKRILIVRDGVDEIHVNCN